MYPTEGPYSKIKPLPVVIADVDGILGNTGNIKLNLENEKCSGTANGIGIAKDIKGNIFKVLN